MGVVYFDVDVGVWMRILAWGINSLLAKLADDSLRLSAQ